MDDEENAKRAEKKAKDKVRIALMDTCKCPICLGKYNHGENQPKLLNCGHRVCKDCLTNDAVRTYRNVAGYSPIRCPFCKCITNREFGDLRENLAESLLVDELCLQAIAFMDKKIGSEDTRDASTQTENSATQTE